MGGVTDPALDTLPNGCKIDLAMGVLLFHYGQFAPHVQRVLFYQQPVGGKNAIPQKRDPLIHLVDAALVFVQPQPYPAR